MIKLYTHNWEIDNIETIIFDKDGTFIDLHYFWGKMTEMRVAEILKKFNLSQDYFQKFCLSLGYDILTGKMLKDGITALYSRVKIIELFKADLANYGLNVTESELTEIFDMVSLQFYKNLAQYTKPIPDAIEFIKKIRSFGLKMGIVTSDSIESTNLTLEHFGWSNLFDVAIGRESSPYTKESGEPTKLALAKLNANPKTTVMIGDAPMDVISAKNAGIEKTILVATGQMDIQDLMQHSDFVVNNCFDIFVN